MKYYIIAKRFDLDGFCQGFNVSVDNDSTDDFDEFLLFDTVEAAKNWLSSYAAAEWKECKFEICEVKDD